MVVVTRADLLRDQLAHGPLGTLRPAGGAPVRVGITGTGETLLVLGWSADDLARERVAGARCLRALGVGPGSRIANVLPGALATPGALLLGDVVEEVGALDVPLGTMETAAAAGPAWELVDRVEPDVIVLDGASGERFLAVAPARARPWWRGIVWLRGAAPFTPPAAPADFAGWQRTWLAVPEATSFVAVSCDRGALHVDEGVHPTVVDGHLVLEPRGLVPPLRYATGIAATLVGCACGGSGPVLEAR